MRGQHDVAVAVALALLCFWPAWSVADTVHVDAAGGGDFATIQEGLDAASDADTVLVAAGIYTGDLNRNLDPGSKNIVIMSTGGPLVTVVDCQQMGRGFHVHGGQDGGTTIQGFTVTGGSVSGSGGGICCEASSAPKIRDCVIAGNIASGEWPDGVGGGLYLGEGCDATVSDCTFDENEAVFGAGALVLSASPVILRCGFFDNTSSSGGGAAACVSASASFIECEAVGNSAAFGGGVACDGGSPSFSDCMFSLNEVQHHGGGMSSHCCCAQIERCTFEANTAGGYGGALISEGSPFSSGQRGDPAPVLVDCVLVSNSGEGGGVYATFGAAPELSSCTLYGNSGGQGGGIFCWQTSATVTDCILAGSLEGAGIHCSDGLAVPYIRRCLIWGNEGGDMPCGDFADILYTDPLFCGAPGGDLTLCADSPCLPGGNPWGQLVGAYGEGCAPCATAVQSSTWGGIKALFRGTGN